MMHAFMVGELLRAPEKRQTKAGNDYATALLRCDGDTLVNVAAFDPGLAERLLALKKGEPKAGLQLTVTELMCGPVRTAKARPKRAAAADGPPPFDDAIPW